MRLSHDTRYDASSFERAEIAPAERALVGGAVGGKLVAAFVLGAAFLAGCVPDRTEDAPSKRKVADLAEASGRRGALNISWFVFRDTNRNGMYDTPDRPYAGFPTRLTGAGERAVTHASNIHGFANFKMSIDPNLGEISAPGLFQLQAQLPAGWVVTSGWETTDLEFRYHQGSPAGIVAFGVPEPLGVAPAPSIRGKIPTGAEATLFATGPNGETSEVQIDPEGKFLLSVETGEWTLLVRNQLTGVEEIRRLEVGYHGVVVGGLLAGGDGRSSDRQPVTVDYDDLTTSDSVYEIPNGYRALNWSNWVATHTYFYQGSGYVNAAVSSEYVAYNGSGHPAVIWSAEPFDLIGTYIGVAWSQAERGLVHLEGFRGDELIYHDAIELHHALPDYLSAHYNGITRLRVYSDVYWQVILEDTRVAVPEAQTR